MDTVTPVGALNTVYSRGEVFRKLSEKAAKNIETRKTVEQTTQAESLPNSGMLELALSETKLFNSGSLPLHGMYEVALIDDNGDGRVDAGDAVSEVLMSATHYEGQSQESKGSSKTLDQVA